MNIHAGKAQGNLSKVAANNVTKSRSAGESAIQFVDNRPEAIVQRKLQAMINQGHQLQSEAQLQDKMQPVQWQEALEEADEMGAKASHIHRSEKMALELPIHPEASADAEVPGPIISFQRRAENEDSKFLRPESGNPKIDGTDLAAVRAEQQQAVREEMEEQRDKVNEKAAKSKPARAAIKIKGPVENTNYRGSDCQRASRMPRRPS